MRLKLPRIDTGNTAITAAFDAWVDALEQACQLEASYPLQVVEIASKRTLVWAAQPTVMGAVLTDALSGGTPSSPGQAGANPAYWDGTRWVADTTVSIVVYTKYTFPATLPIGSHVDVYKMGNDWHVIAATPCPS